MKNDNLLRYDYIDDKKDYNIQLIEDPDEATYREYDMYCDKMNAMKNTLLSKTSLAHMGEYVKSTKERPVVATQALDTCYGILFYDREKHQALCGHAVPSSLIGMLVRLIEELGDDERIIEYLIVPGFRNVDRKDYSGLDELTKYLYENKPKSIKFKPLMTGGIDNVHLDARSLSYEFAFDAESGLFVTSIVFFDATLHNPRYIPPKMRV